MGQNTEAGGEKGVSEVKVKLVVVGDCGCGKTTLIKRYINGSYSDVSTFVMSPRVVGLNKSVFYAHVHVS